MSGILASDAECVERDLAAALVARVSGGNRAAETELVKRYSRGLRHVLRRRTSDAALAEDLMQDTFRIAIERLRKGSIDQPESLAAFLYSTARNLLIAHQRKEWRRATTADSEAVELAADESRNPCEEVSREQVSRLVRQILGELQVPRDREILLRFYVQEQDKEVICSALELDSLHFNRVLHRAKQRFRQLLLHADRRAQLRLVEEGGAMRVEPRV
jgi:RNA polymerase sigma-70 factor, ECF subfamily